MLAWPASVSASDDILIVPQEEPPVQPFEIFDQDLVANDGSGAAIVSHTPTSRGVLVRHAPELKFTYSPDAEFWNAGMDSFSYIFDLQSGERATVFLVVDPRQDLRMTIDPDLEITSSPAALSFRGGSLGMGNFPGGWQPEIRLTADSSANDARLVALQDPKYLIHQPRPGLGDASGSGSGGIDTELDPQGFNLPPGTPAELATVVVNGATDVELSLSQDGGVHLLTATCRRDDGTEIEAFSAALDGGRQPVSLTWWAASVPKALDGGMILEVGNRVVGSFSGFDNHDSFGATDLETRFGAMGAAGGSGSLLLGQLKYWQLRGRPALVPIFADGVESEDTSAWTAAVGSVGVSAAATILGARGIAITSTFPAYLIDDSPAAETHYRARFNFDPSDLTLADGSELTLLAAFDSTATAYPFRVKLRGQSGDLELCTQAQPPVGPPVDVGCYGILRQAYSVRAQWWAAPAGAADGGLGVWLAGPSLTGDPIQIGQHTELANGGQVIEEAHFGVIDPGAGTTGELYLDDFESWR